MKLLRRKAEINLLFDRRSGAGKTLAGLNIANERLKADESEHSVFLSGNGPLVDVLREALTRDSVETAKENGDKLKRTDAEREAKRLFKTSTISETTT